MTTFIIEPISLLLLLFNFPIFAYFVPSRYCVTSFISKKKFETVNGLFKKKNNSLAKVCIDHIILPTMNAR